MSAGDREPIGSHDRRCTFRNSPLSVSAPVFAFVHDVTPATIPEVEPGASIIDNPLTNSDPDAKLRRRTETGEDASPV